MATKHLFIGNFLSKYQGTIGPTELMAKRYEEEGQTIFIASSVKNKLLRLLDMIFKSLFYPYKSISIDVYSGSALMFALITAYIASLRKRKIILILHGGGLVDIYQFKKKRIRSLLKKATYIVTPSRFLQTYFNNEKFEVQYIPNTIDQKLFSFKKERPNSQKILWVRAFTKNYNPDIAVKTFYEVLKEYPKATMTMVGPDKGNLEEIKSLINKLGLASQITITGKIQNADLPEFYRSHDVYLNTTSYESFGVALIEAAACGLPIVSTSVGEIPLLWSNEKDIILSKEINEIELSKGIVTLLKNRNLYDVIQKNAFEKVASFSWENVSKQWDAIIFSR